MLNQRTFVEEVFLLNIVEGFTGIDKNVRRATELELSQPVCSL